MIVPKRVNELKPLEEEDEGWFMDLTWKGKVTIKSKYTRSYLVALDRQKN